MHRGAQPMTAEAPGDLAGIRGAIFGLSGTVLNPAEAGFLAEARPWGVILFSRNIKSPEQTAALVREIRSVLGRNAAVLIDQEGGRVQRLGPPHWRAWPAPMVDAAGPAAQERIWLRSRLIADDLMALGIDVNCAPMLDLASSDAHEIMTSRILGETPELVARQGRAVADALLAGGVLPVVKHIPGHGRATVDSHAALPIISADLPTLRRTDFRPFVALADLPLAMTAHLLIPALDPVAPVTLSAPAIAAIRAEIGFDGALMTDDLAMGALQGPMRERAAQASAAGCDLLLHCSGDLAEMAEIAAAAPLLEGAAARRVAAAEAMRRGPQPFDRAAALARYAALGTEVAA